MRTSAAVGHGKYAWAGSRSRARTTYRAARSWLIWKGFGSPSPLMRSVATNPGWIEVNRMPRGASSTRAASISVRAAAFAAEYGP
ncbi:hypothetical protein SsS58_00142 [Streptomyces scabiei]|uniref:Uncharacterized protein n=1 Tax=Streptomyces scabiei TaxID=1930 RepID=A0A100JHU8_STRSC|nr:hypothetical protein SsS58_00142 [Streptomyces scabiei]